MCYEHFSSAVKPFLCQSNYDIFNRFVCVFQTSDIGAAPIYITDHRLKVVDFSLPFLKTQATMLLRKPPRAHASKIQTVTDLLNQSEIKFGTLDTGLLLWTFRNTKNATLRLLYRKMTMFYPAVFMKSNEEGISRVREEKFAYILPSAIGDYIAQKSPCDLITVDRFLMDRGFGLVFEKKSPLLTIVNAALKKLQESGFVQRTYLKWWIKKSDCGGIRSSSMFGTNGSSTELIIQPLRLVTCVFLSSLFMFSPSGPEFK